MNILDLKIENTSYENILSTIKASLINKKHFSFTYVNAYVAVESRKNKFLKEHLNCFSALYPDGIGIYLASKFLYGRQGLHQRINGTDLYFKILELASSQNYKIFFFGGGEKAADVLESKLRRIFPDLKIGGILKRDIILNETLLDVINQSKSDILFLGLGTPFQEKWIAYLGKKCNIPIQISVGSGIDFISGAYKRAPFIIQRFGFEWLYRLLTEPKRLWRRYIIGIPIFILLVVREKFFGREYENS